MKSGILYLAVLSLFLLSSCQNDTLNKENISASSITQNTRSSEQAVQQEKVTNIVNSLWQEDDSFVRLKFDGTFEAQFKDKILIEGQWSIDDEKSRLQLTQNQSQEGKGYSFQKTYTILEFLPDVLRVEDETKKEMIFKTTDS